MSKIKSIYEFTINKTEEVEVETVSKNDAGAEVKTITKEKTSVPHYFCISKPSRLQSEEAELYFHVEISKGIQAGLMSAALLAKRFANDGGALSEPEKETWSKKYLELVETETSLQKIIATPEESRSEQDKTDREELLKKQGILRRELQNFELQQNSLFEITAEARARVKTVVWWFLNLLHEKDAKGEWQRFFKGGSIKEMMEHFDSYEDVSDEEFRFFRELRDHAQYAVALFYYGRANTQEEFAALMKESK